MQAAQTRATASIEEPDRTERKFDWCRHTVCAKLRRMCGL